MTDNTHDILCEAMQKLCAMQSAQIDQPARYVECADNAVDHAAVPPDRLWSISGNKMYSPMPST